MISSLILMLSQYNKNRKIANIFMCIWFLYAIVISFDNFDFKFLSIGIASFLLTTFCIYFVSRFVSKFSVLLSVCSTIIYSVFIDIVCYFLLPTWCENQSLIQYLIRGVMFNSKYLLSNAFVMIIVVLFSKFSEDLLEKHVRTYRYQ